MSSLANISDGQYQDIYIQILGHIIFRIFIFLAFHFLSHPFIPCFTLSLYFLFFPFFYSLHYIFYIFSSTFSYLVLHCLSVKFSYFTLLYPCRSSLNPYPSVPSFPFCPSHISIAICPVLIFSYLYFPSFLLFNLFLSLPSFSSPVSSSFSSPISFRPVLFFFYLFPSRPSLLLSLSVPIFCSIYSVPLFSSPIPIRFILLFSVLYLSSPFLI